MLSGGLVGVDVGQMAAAGPRRPRIWRLIREGRLRYQKRDPFEHWKTYDELIGQLQAQGYATADCEDLAAAGAAEMRLDRNWRFHDPGASTFVYRSAPKVSHVIIRSPRFGLLDPSVGGGMTLGGVPYHGPDLRTLPYPRPPKYHEGKQFVSVTAPPRVGQGSATMTTAQLVAALSQPGVSEQSKARIRAVLRQRGGPAWPSSATAPVHQYRTPRFRPVGRRRRFVALRRLRVH